MSLDDLRTPERTATGGTGHHPAGGAESGGPTAEPPAAMRAHRRRDTRPVSRFHTRFVSAMKFTLPAAALAMVALLAAWPSLTSLPTPHITADSGQSEMLKPRYFSLDEHNQPFSLVAAKADKSADQPDIVVLDQPQAEMTENAGTWVTMSSDKGWYNQDTGILLMRGNVHVLRDDGNEFTTSEAEADIRKGNAWGDKAVSGQGPQGEIDAKGFRMSDRGKTIVFLNQSKAQVQAAERPGSKKP
ncbi:LPS export ABC transporter periplasmic protein LptC [Azospirillum picis]|uniref:Lipopolysaccharide export system protein LptC n=1 Tax=Azospirillum picis TaxID=488438 RepID=A0ABU0MK67_9PROT|nr:LPS export ABC transporter periplasmic protein LptC [Azospirillum picis]MBP2299970.1 lipopolysaccharide export system protein LptC [Azospirillum picis]MDQ0533792.1 lipopolysaccharide export system protein LptC [Azospirillum picis]